MYKKLVSISDFNWYNMSETKIIESINTRRSYSFVIGYEILKHYKNQAKQKELNRRIRKKQEQSFHSKNSNSSKNYLKKNHSEREEMQTEIEEEIKSKKDFDSKQRSSQNSIKKMEIANFSSSKKDSYMTKKLQNLHFTNLQKLSGQVNELKSLHMNYYLIDHYTSSTVSFFLHLSINIL